MVIDIKKYFSEITISDFKELFKLKLQAVQVVLRFHLHREYSQQKLTEKLTVNI